MGNNRHAGFPTKIGGLVRQDTARKHPREVGPTLDTDLLQEMWFEAFEKTGTATMLVVGNSMRPSILKGDRVVVSTLSEEDSVRAGDVVLLRLENALVVHRILWRAGRKDERRYRQKGDAALISSVVGADAILGKVVGVRQDGGMRRLDAGRWVSGGALLWATVCVTDLLYRGGRLLRQPLRGNALRAPGLLLR